MKKLFIFMLLVSSFFVFTFLDLLAEEDNSSISGYVLADSLDMLTSTQRAKFEDLILESSGTENFAVWWLAGNQNMVWSYDFTYDSSSNIATIGIRYVLRYDGTSGVLTDQTENNIIDNTNVNYLIFKYDHELLHGSEFLPDDTIQVSCPVALNDVLANDYITSLITYVNRGGVNNFIIYRLQHTQDVTDFATINTSIRQVGEIKGYILTTLNGTVQTFVLESNQPTIYQINDGQEYFIYMDLLDPDYVYEWEMVLHSNCLDKSFSSELDALGSVNESIVTTIAQNTTIINQNESIIEQNQITNNLIDTGSQESQAAGDELASRGHLFLQRGQELESIENGALLNLQRSLNDVNFDFSNLFSDSPISLVSGLMTKVLEPVIEVYSFILSISFILFMIGRVRK